VQNPPKIRQYQRMRLGFGVRHPSVAALLERHEPEAAADSDFGMRVRVRAHLGSAELPDDFVLSVRCLVQVGDRVLVCKTPSGWHPWPGGRREQDESHFETATREVQEETGWVLDRAPFRLLGWLHIEHLDPMPESHPFPHPDFLQVVYSGTAGASGAPPADWVDIEGHETETRIVSVEEALAMCPPEMLADVFLRQL
jgi:8-oxo-dGTP pyrophosphatase MutT (NUDIX family)